jgi:NADH-quinone oxidoreductase subunit J
MFLFIVFSLIAIVAAAGVIVSRRPIYSALFLLVNFATLAALYVMLQAQFLAVVQVIVYGGAIVVLFLFVVMLLGGGELNDIRDPSRPLSQRFRWPQIAALTLAVLLLAAVGYGLVTGQLSPVQGDAVSFGQGSVQAIGAVLYTDYVLPFELASVLLLVGMIGAVVLARPAE